MPLTYLALKRLHRNFRLKLKDTFRPEVSQRKINSFIKEKCSLKQPTFSLNNEARLAVVIPCYGHALFLEEMFESIRMQTLAPNQIIFVIDCSPDNSLDILRNLISKHQEKMDSELIILENQSNLGQAASLNKGIEYANAEIIMILNDDDYLMHDSVEVIYKILKHYPHAALVGGHSLHFGGDELKQIPKLIQSICPIDQIEIDLRLPSQVKTYRKYNDVNMTHSGSSFYKSAWEFIGGYYPDKSKRLVHFSDRDFQLRMNAIFPIILSNVTPLSCWRNDSSVDQGINS